MKNYAVLVNVLVGKNLCLYSKKLFLLP